MDETDSKGVKKKSDRLGISSKRSCTDVICCILFLVFILGLGVIAVWAFINGNTKRLVYPTDSTGMLCGLDVKGKPNLVFFNLLTCLKIGTQVLNTGCPTHQVCREKCPDYLWNWVQASAEGDSEAQRAKMICQDGENGNSVQNKKHSIQELIELDRCAAIIVPSEPVARRCLPIKMRHLVPKLNGTALTNMKKSMFVLTRAFRFGKYIGEDFVASIKTVALACVLAMIVSFLYIFILRLMACIVVWFIIIQIFLLFLLIAMFSGYRWQQIRYYSGKTVLLPSEMMKAPAPLEDLIYKMEGMWQYENTWLIIGIISSILSICFLLIICFLRTQIRIATEIIAEASRAMGAMLSTLFWPICTTLMKAFVILICGTIALYLACSSRAQGFLHRPYMLNVTTDITMNTTFSDNVRSKLVELTELLPCEPNPNGTLGEFCHFLKYGGDQFVNLFHLYNLFMFLWLTNFVIDLGSMTLAGAYAGHYFSRSGSRPTLPVLHSFWNCLRYHMGSLALGSLLVAIIELLQIIMEYIRRKTQETNSVFGQFLAKCCMCCLACFKRFIQFLNKNAYIMIAIHGQSFCSAALSAFSLLLRNALRVIAVESITAFILFLGRLLIALSFGGLAFVFYDGTLGHLYPPIKDYTPTLHYPLLPVAIIVLISFLIATLFFNVYKMAVNTTFLCFLEDIERNDGSAEKPYFMNKKLMQILGKKNKETVDGPVPSGDNVEMA